MSLLNCFEMTIKCSSNIILISLPLTKDATTVKIPTRFPGDGSLTFNNTFHFNVSPLYHAFFQSHWILDISSDTRRKSWRFTFLQTTDTLNILSLSQYLSHHVLIPLICVDFQEMKGMVVTKPDTTVQDCVSAFLSAKPPHMTGCWDNIQPGFGQQNQVF